MYDFVRALRLFFSSLYAYIYINIWIYAYTLEIYHFAFFLSSAVRQVFNKMRLFLNIYYTYLSAYTDLQKVNNDLQADERKTERKLIYLWKNS